MGISFGFHSNFGSIPFRVVVFWLIWDLVSCFGSVRFGFHSLLNGFGLGLGGYQFRRAPFHHTSGQTKRQYNEKNQAIFFHCKVLSWSYTVFVYCITLSRICQDAKTYILAHMKVFEKISTFFQKPIAFFKKIWYNIKVSENGPLVKRLRRRPLTAKAWVRFP